jgi:hypothetical protein
MINLKLLKISFNHVDLIASIYRLKISTLANICLFLVTNLMRPLRLFIKLLMECFDFNVSPS